MSCLKRHLLPLGHLPCFQSLHTAISDVEPFWLTLFPFFFVVTIFSLLLLVDSVVFPPVDIVLGRTGAVELRYHNKNHSLSLRTVSFTYTLDADWDPPGLELSFWFAWTFCLKLKISQGVNVFSERRKSAPLLCPCPPQAHCAEICIRPRTDSGLSTRRDMLFRCLEYVADSE